MSMLASLGSRHLHNLAWTSLQHHKAVLTQSTALHGEGKRSPSISTGEISIKISHDGLIDEDSVRRGKRNNYHIHVIRYLHIKEYSWYQIVILCLYIYPLFAWYYHGAMLKKIQGSTTVHLQKYFILIFLKKQFTQKKKKKVKLPIFISSVEHKRICEKLQQTSMITKTRVQRRKVIQARNDTRRG